MQNTRYTLLVMVPNRSEGLKDLIKNFNSDSLSSAQKSLVQKSVQITLPKFHIDTTSRAEKALAKVEVLRFNSLPLANPFPLFQLGLITMFTSKADLSGITDEQKIHVDELVQHVSIRVDEGASSELSLSAANTVEAKTGDDQDIEEVTTVAASADAAAERFVVDRPFVFFVRDTLDGTVIVAGKITDVPAADE